MLNIQYYDWLNCFECYLVTVTEKDEKRKSLKKGYKKKRGGWIEKAEELKEPKWIKVSKTV